MMYNQEEDCIDNDATLFNNNNSITHEKKRQLAQRECSTSGNVFGYQAHVEIVSAIGFNQPNILFSAPFGSGESCSRRVMLSRHTLILYYSFNIARISLDLAIRYKILEPSSCRGKKQDVIQKGSTNILQNYAVLETSIKFLALFSVVSICIVFVSAILPTCYACCSYFFCHSCLAFPNHLYMIDFPSSFMQTTLHLLGKSFGNDVSPAILLSIVPLGLICQFLVFGNAKVKHVNHQFSLLYSKSRQINDDKVAVIESPQNAKMEIHAYFHHNFGLISLAGSAFIDLPSEPGTYDIEVQTIKPIACTGMNERRCRLHSYYLGSSLDGGSDIIQPIDLEGLITDGSGTIRIRVNVMKNHFKNGLYGYNNTDYYDEFVSPNHREKMQETVDEVLSRVRRNKRLRVSRMMNTPSSYYGTSRRHRRRDYNVGAVETKEEEKEEETKHQSDRSADN